jgi:hypothetical protein
MEASATEKDAITRVCCWQHIAEVLLNRPELVAMIAEKPWGKALQERGAARGYFEGVMRLAIERLTFTLPKEKENEH